MDLINNTPRNNLQNVMYDNMMKRWNIQHFTCYPCLSTWEIYKSQILKPSNYFGFLFYIGLEFYME